MDVPINRTFIYPKYGVVDKHDNIALVRLEVPVTFTSMYAFIKLGEEHKHPFESLMHLC